MLTVGSICIPLNEFDLRFSRSSGPGGQNVNKVNSKVLLYWDVATSSSLPGAVRERFLQRYGHRLTSDGVLVLSSDRFRDQKRNIDDCLEKLSTMLSTVIAPPTPRRPTKPTKGSKERRLKGKSEHKTKKLMRQKPNY
jgi:ribosome-associated protein